MGAEHRGISSGRTVPKSIRHKKILDVAAERPDASLEAIAKEIPSATADLVENVLEEHGDPAEAGTHEQPAAGTTVEDQSAAETNADDQSAAEFETDDQGEGDAQPARDLSPSAKKMDYPDPSDLTERQRETLRTIRANPQSTQREIADVLGVSGATVSNRVNAIDGFDWSDRRAITEAMFDDEFSDTNVDSNRTTNGEDSDRVDKAEGASGSDNADGSVSSGKNGDSDPMIPVNGDSDSGSNDDIGSNGDSGSNGDAESEGNVNSDGDVDDAGDTELEAAVDRLGERIAAIERQLEESADPSKSGVASTEPYSPLADPELMHRVMHACLKANTIAEEEELQLMRALLR